MAMDVNPDNPEYKMGIGGRILGTVANFLSGFGGHGPVVDTGGGAHNWKYQRDKDLHDYQAGHDAAQKEKQEKEKQPAPGVHPPAAPGLPGGDQPGLWHPEWDQFPR